jgi:hypothetical protein
MATYCTSTKSVTNLQKETIKSNIEGKGIELTIDFTSGQAHNHPTFAVWVEDMNENYIQTLFVTKSIATGVFGHGEREQGKWNAKPGAVRRPATLPYWLHKRGVKADDGTYLPSPEKPVPDAYTGATPMADFTLNTKTDQPLNGKFRILLEINQAWDFNEFWTNTKYPDDFNYLTSAQPSVIYAVTVDLNSDVKEYFLNPIGHGHYSGKDGMLYTDLSSFTTALKIADIIKVNVN